METLEMDKKTQIEAIDAQIKNLQENPDDTNEDNERTLANLKHRKELLEAEIGQEKIAA